jgi:hypothetical protein
LFEAENVALCSRAQDYLLSGEVKQECAAATSFNYFENGALICVQRVLLSMVVASVKFFLLSSFLIQRTFRFQRIIF